MTILQSLRSLSNYPIPSMTIQDIVEGVGLETDETLTAEVRKRKSFLQAKAYIYFFLSEAPDVSQSGISYSFSDEEKKRFKTKGESILDSIGDDGSSLGVEYGYMGSDL